MAENKPAVQDKPIVRVKFASQIQVGNETTQFIHCKSHKCKARLTDIGVLFVFEKTPNAEYTVPYAQIQVIER